MREKEKNEPMSKFQHAPKTGQFDIALGASCYPTKIRQTAS